MNTTLQISNDGNCAQHKARFNGMPPQEHVALAAELSAYIRILYSDEENDYAQSLLDSIPYHGDILDDIDNQVEV